MSRQASARLLYPDSIKSGIFMKHFSRTLLASALAAFISQSACADNLMDLYQIAQKEDRAYQAELSKNRSVKVGEEIADSDYYPTIGLDAAALATNTDSPGASADGYTDSVSMELSLSQPIYNRNLDLKSDTASLSSSKSDADLLSARQDLIVRLGAAYFEILAAQDTRTFVEADKKAIARQLEQAQQRFDVGLIAITSVHEAQARYDKAVADEIAVNNRVDQAYEALQEIVGVRELQLDLLAENIKFESPEPTSLEEWSDLALKQNPGVVSARYTSEVAVKSIEIQRSGHYPTLNLIASQTYAERGNPNSDFDESQIGLAFKLPLYEGGGVDAAVRQAQLDFETAQYNLEKQERLVTRSVKDAYRGLVANISRIKALEAVKVSAKSALDATEAGYEVGTRTIVDVLDAQRDLYLSMKDYADARYLYMNNLLKLKQAAGTLAEADVEKINQWLVKP
jgi:outer membrane protein